MWSQCCVVGVATSFLSRIGFGINFKSILPGVHSTVFPNTVLFKLLHRDSRNGYFASRRLKIKKRFRPWICSNFLMRWIYSLMPGYVLDKAASFYIDLLYRFGDNFSLQMCLSINEAEYGITYLAWLVIFLIREGCQMRIVKEFRILEFDEVHHCRDLPLNGTANINKCAPSLTWLFIKNVYYNKKVAYITPKRSATTRSAEVSEAGFLIKRSCLKKNFT